MTISSRQPRPIGSTRPSRRVPPSSIEAKTMPPKMSSSGWARKMTARMARPRPNQTLARFSSWRMTGSRSSDGPSGSAAGAAARLAHRRCSPPVAAGAPAIGMERAAGAAAAQGGEPADRVEVARAAVEREGDELGAAADILPRHRPAEALLLEPAKRLSAQWSRLSPIRKTWPSGTVIGAKSSPCE